MDNNFVVSVIEPNLMHDPDRFFRRTLSVECRTLSDGLSEIIEKIGSPRSESTICAIIEDVILAKDETEHWPGFQAAIDALCDAAAAIEAGWHKHDVEMFGAPVSRA